MLKFHIDLAEAAAKTLQANFLEANLKAVIYSAAQTLLLSDSWTFFSILHPPPLSLLYTHLFIVSQFCVCRFHQPSVFLPRFTEQGPV